MKYANIAPSIHSSNTLYSNHGIYKILENELKMISSAQAPSWCRRHFSFPRSVVLLFSIVLSKLSFLHQVRVHSSTIKNSTIITSRIKHVEKEN